MDQSCYNKNEMVSSAENETLPKTNNGPRVSFNRDVHVKRYGSLLNNDIVNYESNSRSQSPANLRRELPNDLSNEALEREAALVLEQVNNFGSLPHRKQHYRRPIRRSKSDASSKKAKRNSIFNIFNSTPVVTNLTSSSVASNNNKKNNTNEKSVNNNNKKVTRSKSDMSQQKREKYRNKIHLDGYNNINSNNNNNQVLTNSSDSSDTNFAYLTSTPLKKIPLSPITEVNSPLSDANNCTDYFLLNKPKVEKLTIDKTLTDFSGHDSNVNTSSNLPAIQATSFSKSMEAMHSSQKPVEKPSLTKGMAVDKMIKRLSIEQISPPPVQVLNAGGFSYTNPQLSSPTSPVTITFTKQKSLSPPITSKNYSNNIGNSNNHNLNSDIVYAQVVCKDKKNADGSETIQSKETVRNTLKKSRQSASPPKLKSNDYLDQSSDTFDFLNKTATSPIANERKNSHRMLMRSERDETDNIAVADEEPIIKPNIRKQIPRYPSNTNINNTNNNNIHNNLDSEFDDMHETEFNGVDASLSSRRKILESRIKSRIGGLHINNDNHNTFNNNIRRSASPPPTTKRYSKYGSNEIINRFSPERAHYSPSRDETYVKNYTENGALHRKYSSSFAKHHDKTDSGIETDNVARNNRKNRPSSRFNIGRKWNYEDDIIECELFLMKERKHTEETYPYHLVRTFVYREANVNDGSHYDPNEDKKNIIKEWKHNKKLTRDFLKSQKKKKSGIERVKELFKSKTKTSENDGGELRSRYREYSPELKPPPKLNAQQDIASRRRLSTPTASPVIPNRSKSLPPKVMSRKTSTNNTTNTMRSDKENNSQKFNWFTSLERLSRRKNRETSAPTTIERKSSITRTKSTSLKNIPESNHSNSNSNKTLRFFGDTEDDADTITKTSQEIRQKSSSLQNLNSNRKMKQSKTISRSRAELQHIAESTSDEFTGNAGESTIRSKTSTLTSSKYLPPPRPPKSSKLVNSVSTLPRPSRVVYEENDTNREYSHNGDSMPYYHKKDNFESDSNFSSTRRFRDSLSVSRENLHHRERFDSDASQRSVVYLHATTVGDIIPSHTLGRRVSGNKMNFQDEQPTIGMRTVNRSVSLNAPWKPKFISDGYEINYNNDQQKAKHQRRSKSATRERH